MHLPSHARSALVALLGIVPGAAVAASAADAEPGPVPGWVTIHSRGRSFEMGQQFAGHRWTFTYPVHPVAFTYDFTMCATAVTQAEYRAIAGANPSLHPGDDRRPVDNISWFDAVVYCNALSARDHLAPVYGYASIVRDASGAAVGLPGLTVNRRAPGYRLLTSGEFEYVVRAGTTSRWFFGDRDLDQSASKAYAWSELNSGNTTHPVGMLKPNPYGVYDMTGNLWIWCGDWYGGAYPSTRQVDPEGPAAGDERVARGGAFKNDVNHERSAYHWQWAPGLRNFEVGFRIARTIPPPSDSPLKFSDINEEAWYKIIAENSGKTLEVAAGPGAQEGRPLQQNESTGSDNQLFRFRRVRSGYYQILTKQEGQALRIRGSSLLDHAPVEQNADTGAENQLFTLVKDTDDAYSIVAKISGYCFDISGGVGSVGNGAPVIVYAPGNALNHKFAIIEASLADFRPVVTPLSEVPAYKPPFDAAAAGMRPLFDGRTLDGWVGDPACWKVADGAIIGVKGNQNLMTREDFDDFRIIVSTIQVDSPTNHQGIGFWGERLPQGTYGYGGCIDVMPPMNWTWDYTTNRGANGALRLNRDLDKDLGITRSEWTQAEILVNRAKGRIRMAVDGIEVLDYTDRNPSRLKRGPIGLQAHGGNRDVRYKDIFIETSVREDRLITLRD
jgi:formylglycine-generating enzyme